jgi:hypothetical protein
MMMKKKIIKKSSKQKKKVVAVTKNHKPKVKIKLKTNAIKKKIKNSPVEKSVAKKRAKIKAKKITRNLVFRTTKPSKNKQTKRNNKRVVVDQFNSNVDIDSLAVIDINLEDFIFSEQNKFVQPVMGDYDLEKALAEYNVDNSIYENNKSSTEISNKPKIKVSANNVRSAYLLNLGLSSITKQPLEKIIKDKHENVFEQPRKKISWPTFNKIKRDRADSSHYFSNPLKLQMVIRFAAIILLLLLPLRVLHVYNAVGNTKTKVLGITELGIDSFKSGTKAAKSNAWQNAIIDFNQAAESFAKAASVLQQVKTTSFSLADKIPVIGKTFSSSQALLQVGNLSTQTASQISSMLNELKEDSANDLGNKIVIIKNNFDSINNSIEKINNLLKKIDIDSLPSEYQPQLRLLVAGLPQLQESFSELNDFIQFTDKVLGFDQEKRYIFVFQNNNELRASGGFMGSFGLVDVKNGKIEKIEVPGGGFYDLKSSFFEKIISPQPLHLVGFPWGIWDSNWWPDFPTTAQKLQWFLEKSRWPTVDGIIAFNASLVPKLINLTGDIELPAYNKKLDANNAVLALQHAVEFEYDKQTNKPKQIIGDLMPVLINRLFQITSSQPLPLILTLQQAFNQAEAQMYFSDPELENFVKSRNWAGEQKQTDGDYLMVVNSNIAGGKTDGVIKQKETLYSYPQSDGSIIHTLTINRSHFGRPDDVFERLNNVSYIRVYTPLNSELLEVSGQNPPEQKYFKAIIPGYSPDEDLKKIETNKSKDSVSDTDIYQENNKQVFANWLQVEPGQSKTLTLSYRVLPDKNNGNWMTIFKKLLDLESKNYQTYNLYWQKQSGSNTFFEHQLILPADKKIIWSDSTGQKQKNENNKLITTGQLNLDTMIAVIFGKS